MERMGTMEKTYKFLDHAKPLPIDEIKRLYKGYWVFLVNAEFSITNKLISGKPVIIGSRAYDGARDGIYEKYKAAEYEPQTDISLLSNAVERLEDNGRLTV